MAPKKQAEAADKAADEGYDYDMPVIINVKPDDQLHLTPEELDKELSKIIYPNNPRAAHNTTYFSYKERCYKQDAVVDQTTTHFAMDPSILKKESPDELLQQDILTRKASEQAERNAQEAVDVEIEEIKGEEARRNTLRNQFNFSERASQTFNEVTRNKTISTQPPKCQVFADTVSQWMVYDGYADLLASETKVKTVKNPLDDLDTKKRTSESDPIYSDAMRLSIKLMERMVNQNAENEVYHDFKYWEDESDQYRADGDGSLLPLWRFASERLKRKQVTCIRWNPKYNDLFAVGFGSYEFMRQSTGSICCYSLKNTKFPEFVFNTDTSVCSLDWHPTQPHLLAVGCYDGSVLVYDVRGRTKKPLYASTIRTGKHTDPVWEVRWDETQEGTPCFFSISADGKVAKYYLMKTELKQESVMELKLVSGGDEADNDDTALSGLAAGLAFDFHKTRTHLYLIGTEEGRIHKCSKAYSGQYLETYVGHSMAVYTVKWNSFHPDIFISSSADWTVKLWDHRSKTPVMSFDLGQAVGDVSWAPYSSTVWGAITTDGKLHCYDLNSNRNEAVACQKVVRRAKLTHVAFNGDYPLILVGDDRGGVNSLKLSPNLRLATNAPEGEEAPLTGDALKEQQIGTMEHYLEMVQDTTKSTE